MNNLHRTQARLLELLKQNHTEPLTMMELKDQLNLSSTSVVFHHIRQLEKKGFLRRNPANTNDYQVLAEDDKDKKIAYLNLYGLAQCGPNGVVLEDAPVDRIPISTQILGFSSSDAFLVRARGNSMMPKIYNNDLVIVKKTENINDGDVAVCVNDGQAVIKKVRKSGSKIFLFSENNDFESFPASDDFRVVGVVRGVLSYTI